MNRQYFVMLSLTLSAFVLSACDPRPWRQYQIGPESAQIRNAAVFPGEAPQLAAVGRICPPPTSSGTHAFLNESFLAIVELSIPQAGAGKQLRISVGIDSRGARGTVIDIPADASGTLVLCPAFSLDWPGPAQLRAELFQGDTWLSRDELSFAVVPRDRVAAVLFPRYAHPTARRGSTYRVGNTLELQTDVLIANGTASPRSAGPTVSGSVNAGAGGVQNWTQTLSSSITVPAYSVSSPVTVPVTLDFSSSVGQTAYNDKVVMLGQVAGADTTGFGTIDWKAMRGIAVDVVFVGDFTPAQRQSAFDAIVNRAGGHFQPAGVILNRSLSRQHLAADVGMSPAQIDEFRIIEDSASSAALAFFQPSKSIPRLTVYVVEGLFSGAGFVGSFAGGGATPVNPNTPLRSPILQMPSNFSATGFYSGVDFFAQTAAHEIGHAFGLSHTREDSCADTDIARAEDAFNMLFAFSAAYSWVITPCQAAIMSGHPQFYAF